MTDTDNPNRLAMQLAMGRANWSSGYFQAEVYRQMLQELGYEVSDPADQEVDPSLGYLAMAQGDFDLWVNSWYPGHLAWHEAEMPDGTLVGDHLEIIGGVFQEEEWRTAVGSTHIQPGDRAIAICTSLGLKELQRLFLG